MLRGGGGPQVKGEGKGGRREVVSTVPGGL